MNKPLYLFTFLLFCLAGCKNTNVRTTGQAVELFDLKPIVEQDIELNKINHIKQKKIIRINHKQDIIQTKNVDWAKDLQVLLNSDINKKDWQDKFTVQTTDQSDSTEVIKYLSVSNKIPVKNMTVLRNKNNQTVQEIYIEKIIQSGLFSNEQMITYKPATYLKIKSVQKAVFIKDFVSEIEIYFIQ